MKVRAIGIAVAVVGCNPPEFIPVVPPEAPEAEADPWDICDAGDEAWVQRALPLIWGRQPHGSAEVRIWVAAVQSAGREAVVQALTEDAAYLDHQSDVFMDAMRVPRTGGRVDFGCWAGPLRREDSGQLARQLAHATPADSADGLYNMADVLRSALQADDLSVVYRAALFSRLHKPLTGANVGPLELEENRRIELGDEFYEVWLRRNLDCVPCHNSAYSTTDHPEPSLDRTWAIPGLFERALLGEDGGIAPETAYAAFRYEPLEDLTDSPVAPFGLSGCGEVARPGGFGEDLLGHDAFFISALGSEGSVWDVEAALHVGVDALRDRGHIWAEGEVPAGPEAFAWLVGESIVETAWTEATGKPLSVSHRFPRNEAQRDRLFALTDHFVREGFSLRTLLTDIALDPIFNAGLPETCGAAPYGMPPVVDPFSVENEEPTEQGNGPSDRVRRWPGRVLVRSVHDSMGWVQPPHLPTEDEPVLDLYEGIGVSLRRSQPRFDGVDFQGMLAWEDHFGTCTEPENEPGCEDGCVATPAVPGCGNCNCQECTCSLDPYCCAVQWDDTCVEMCNTDCGGCGNETSARDTIERLMEAAVERDATVGDLVAALRDRLLTDGSIDGDEEVLMEAILGAPLGLSVAEALEHESFEPSVRLLCGALLRTPDFLLELERSSVAEVPVLSLDVDQDCARMQARMEALGHSVDCPEVP